MVDNYSNRTVERDVVGVFLDFVQEPLQNDLHSAGWL